jgi:glycosyltransferase involved in cell wall biosynthesis
VEALSGIPAVDLAGLAKGLPLIANALGGIPEYVADGETGWLNPDASGDGIAQLMAAAIDDHAGVERLRGAVRERRGRIVRSMGEHVAEVDELYAELTSAAAQAAAISSPAARRTGS